MKKKQKNLLARIIIGGVLFFCTLAAARFFVINKWIILAAYIVVYVLTGWDVVWKAVRGIISGQVFDENFLMTLATAGAFAVGEYPEAAAVMLFYQTGELFQSLAVAKSRRSISALMDIRPETANVENENGIEETDPSEVAPGTVIVIRAGERVPIDGVVIEGKSYLDMSALTGESVPSAVREGDEVISGCINGSGVLRVRTTKLFSDSAVSRILELTENAASKKAKAENFITKFARVYTPCVVAAAVLLAAVPSLICGNFSEWLHRALIFLVVSCPCALVISVPLGFFGGIGGAGKRGILIKGGTHMEMLARTHTVVFDKTGTLTEGVFEVTGVHPVAGDADSLLSLAAAAEKTSSHPVARPIVEAADDAQLPEVTDVHETMGKGVSALLDGERILVGGAVLLRDAGIDVLVPEETGTVVYVSRGETLLGYITVADRIKKNAASAVASLKKNGVRTVMLTGDGESVGRAAASAVGIDEARCGLLPQNKVEEVERLMAGSNGKPGLVFVGDGIHDAPVLTRADVGIAMGAIGSDAAIEAADVVLTDDSPEKVAEAVKISRRTLRIVRENIVFALVVKAAVLLLGALGIAGMWEAVFADVGVSVIAVLNSMRTLKNVK